MIDVNEYFLITFMSVFELTVWVNLPIIITIQRELNGDLFEFREFIILEEA